MPHVTGMRLEQVSGRALFYGTCAVERSVGLLVNFHPVVPQCGHFPRDEHSRASRGTCHGFGVNTRQVIKAKGHLPFPEVRCSRAQASWTNRRLIGGARATPAAALGQWYDFFTEGQEEDTIPGVPPQPPQLQRLAAAVPALTGH